MSPWTALLESLHSALIDELTERLPKKQKPTLGLPVRQKDLLPPKSALRTLLAVPVHIPPSEFGYALVALEPAVAETLKVSAHELFQEVVRRAQSEFARRGIAPLFQESIELAARNGTTALPLGESAPTRVVWIPFSIPSGNCFLGIGA